MEKQRVYIDKYDWLVDIFFLPTKQDMPFILNEMYKNGASPSSFDAVSCNMCKKNGGCAYTNPYSKYTMLIIGRVTNLGEFFNTFVHEINHLCSAIEEEYCIDPHGEEASYLIGDTTMQIFNQICE